MLRKWRWGLAVVIVIFAVIGFAPVVVGAASHTEELDGYKEFTKANLDGLKAFYCSLDHTALC